MPDYSFSNFEKVAKEDLPDSFDDEDIKYILLSGGGHIFVEYIIKCGAIKTFTKIFELCNDDKIMCDYIYISEWNNKPILWIYGASVYLTNKEINNYISNMKNRKISIYD